MHRAAYNEVVMHDAMKAKMLRSAHDACWRLAALSEPLPAVRISSLRFDA
jgi:hypothetical protein